MDGLGSYQFGEFRIDLENRLLTRQGQLVPIRSRLFDVLMFLVKHRGEVVTRDAILDQVWRDVAVEDGNISQAIYFLRQIIDDPNQGESWILTVPKRGYLFVAGAREATADLLPDRSLEGVDGTVAGPPSDESAPLTPFWRRTGVRIGLVFLILLLSFLVGLYLLLGSSIRTLRILSYYPIPSQQLDPEFSPDGKFLAFSGLGETGGNEDIYLKSLDQDQRIRLTTHPDIDRNPAWSPDGKRIALLRWASDGRGSAKVIIVDRANGQEEEVGRSRGALGWMPDGRHLIVSDLELDKDGDAGGPISTVLFLLPLDGHALRQLTWSTAPGTVDTMPRAAFYRDSIAFLRTTGGPRGEVYLLDLPSGQVAQATHEEGAISFFRWGLREGGFYLVSDRQGAPRLWHFGLPGFASTIYGNTGPARLVDQMPYQLNQFALLPGPPLLAYAHQIREEQVRLINIAGQKTVRPREGCLLPDARTDEPPQFSPSGDQVVYLSSLRGKEGLWKAAADCTRQVQLLETGSNRMGHPRWSPDGSRIVYQQQVGDQTEIWTLGADGSTPLRLTDNNVEEIDPSWSSDGRSIYYVARVEGRETIRRLPARGGESVLVVASGGREPVESADGQRLYFVQEGALFACALTATGNPDGALVKTRHQLQIGQNAQLGSATLTFLDDNPNPAVLLDQLDLSTGKTEQLIKVDGVIAPAAGGMAISADKRYLSIVLYQGSIGELTTVEGWRLKPLSEYLIDRLHVEAVMYPTRWWKKIWD